MPRDAIIVGAGINGLSAAWQLARRGARVRVLDRFAPGHTLGSSHGATRITRACYPDPLWVSLMAVAHGEEWPALEAETGQSLIQRAAGCFFGPAEGPMADYAAVGDASIERLSWAEAGRRFPLFRFDKDDLVLADHSAGVVAADLSLRALTAAILARGGTLRADADVVAIEPGPPHRVILRDGGVLHTDHLVVCAGPWASALLGPLAPGHTPLTVLGQTVGFYELPGADASPPWAYIAADRFFYGLPGRPGLKAARYHAVGPDEGTAPIVPDPAAITAFLAEKLWPDVGQPLRTETCFFTMASQEVFVLDLVAPGLAVGAGFSGHGFKLGPVSGRILAGLCLDGGSDVPVFEASRARFRLQRDDAPVSVR